MANPIAELGGTHEMISRYHDTMIRILSTRQVVRKLFNREYEGSVVAGAIKVIKRRKDPETQIYNWFTGVDLTQSATEMLDILINQNSAINEILNGFERLGVADKSKMIGQRLDAAVRTKSKELEKNAIIQLEGGQVKLANLTMETVAGGTVLNDTAELTSNKAYPSIIDASVKLLDMALDPQELKIIIPWSTQALLLKDKDYITNTSGALGAELARQGIIGKINGIDVIPSSDLNAKTEFIIFAPEFASAVDEFKEELAIERIMDGRHIGASSMQSLYVFKDTLLDPTTCIVKKKA